MMNKISLSIAATVLMTLSPWAYAQSDGASLVTVIIVLIGIVMLPVAILYSIFLTLVVRKKTAECEHLMERASGRDKFWDFQSMKGRIELTFYAIQEAWDQRNKTMLRAYMSEHLYRRFKMEMLEKVVLDKRKTFEQAHLEEAKIVEVLDFADDAKDTFWVLISGTRVEYSLHPSDGSRKFNEATRHGFEELWRFVRAEHGWVLDEIDHNVSLGDLTRLNSQYEEVA
ncbi:hypothetical protein [Thaumasiovibrio subtropicus]|uniref:hypothetical protein n=1 Tax=Thaumasiovibrio subtropicus TaxID=1891207 RepID=UPI000B362BD0|nr:hypothetical protein [Thaumasiovibrio subtropicus]